MSCFSSFNRLCQKIINDKDMIDRKFRGQAPPYQLLTILNNRNQQLSTIIFHKDSSFPAIIYLHGNGGNKIQVLHLVKTVEQFPFNMVAFDFSGCGKSEGEFLTYGEQQVDDIHAVVEYLRGKYKAKSVFLWGRSMGASLGLLYGAKYPNRIKGMILDSPFRSLQKIVYNVADNVQPMVPNFLVSIGVYFVKSNVQNIVNQDIFNLDYTMAYQHLVSQKMPLIFAFSTKDNVVKEEDVMEMYFLYNGPKKLAQFNCLHPDDRPKQFIHQCLEYLLKINGMPKFHHQKHIDTYSEREINGYEHQQFKERKKISVSNTSPRNKWNNK